MEQGESFREHRGLTVTEIEADQAKIMGGGGTEMVGAEEKRTEDERKTDAKDD